MSAYKPKNDGLMRTVNSVLNQTFKDFEFIIIKDDEDDSTLSLLEKIKLNDKRIILIDNIKNIGLVKSLNKGLRESKAKYIARIDVDDWWNENKLQLQYELMLKKKLVIVGTKVKFVTIDLKPLINIDMPVCSEDIKQYLQSGKNPFTHSSVLFKKFDGIFYNEKALHTEDFELWLRYSLLGNMENVPDILTNYMIDLDSITNSKRYIMYVNATKIFLNYANFLKTNNKSFIKDGLIDDPVTSMGFFDELFSKYYSLSIKSLFQENIYMYYIYFIFALLLNPKIWFYFFKRKFMY